MFWTVAITILVMEDLDFLQTTLAVEFIAALFQRHTIGNITKGNKKMVTVLIVKDEAAALGYQQHPKVSGELFYFFGDSTLVISVGKKVFHF